MHEQILENSLKTLFDWLFVFNSQEIKTYVEKISSAHPSLGQREIAQIIVDEQSMNNGLCGAVTGLGSTIALPLTIPLDAFKAWKIQSFMIHAIAYVYGYTPHNTDLKTAAIALLASGSAEEFKQFFASEVQSKVNENLIKTFDFFKQSTIKVAAKEGSRLTTKLATKALGKIFGKKVLQKSLGFAAPALGAAIGGGIDWVSTQTLGSLAIAYFENLSLEFS
jgi:EcsC protein family